MSQRFEIDHPADNPKLPSFVHPTLADLEEELAFLFDAWNNLRNVKGDYLPQEEEEPDEAYKARLDRAVWTDFFAAGIRGFAGVMSRFELKDPPPSMEKAQSNIDLQGNSIHAFFLQADQMVMRDGAVPILVEMSSEEAGTNADRIRRPNMRPYLVMHPRRMVLSWRCDSDQGTERVRQVVILEWQEEDAGGEEGFGVAYKPLYRILRPGEWFLVEIDTKGQEPRLVEIDSGQYLDHRQQPLDYVPIVWYSATRQTFGEGLPPLLHQARLNLQHFRKTSDYEEKDHRVNMPVPVEKGGLPPQPGQKEQPQAIGPNTLRRVSENGDFFFAEPDATSLRETRAGIEAVEAHMREGSMNFMYGASTQAKTATQAGLEAASTQASITTLREQKENVIQQLARIWCDFTGEQLSEDAGISMGTALFDRPITPQDQDSLGKFADQRLVSRQSVIHELQRAGILTATSSPREELKRIAEELRSDMAAARKAAEEAMGDGPGDEEDESLPSSGDRTPSGQPTQRQRPSEGTGGEAGGAEGDG